MRLSVIYILILLGILFGCTTPEDDPEIEFFLSKPWKLSQILLQDPDLDIFFSCGVDEGVIDAYRLRLNPENTFDEVDFCGAPQSGKWDLQFDGQILQLRYEEKANDFVPDTLEYIIESVEIRKVILKLITDESKTGDSGIRLELEPVKL